MKKLFTITLMTLALFGCYAQKSKSSQNHKLKKRTAVAKVMASNCDNTLEIGTRNPGANLPERLINEGNIICDLCLYSDIEKWHSISESDYNEHLTKFWGTNLNTVKYIEVTWSKIKEWTTGHCYDQYLTFLYDDTKTELPDAIMQNHNVPPPADVNKCVFSVPLFRSIGLNHHLCNEDKFLFAKALVGGQIKVVFKVIKAGDTEEEIVYCNISDEPTK